MCSHSIPNFMVYFEVNSFNHAKPMDFWLRNNQTRIKNPAALPLLWEEVKRVVRNLKGRKSPGRNIGIHPFKILQIYASESQHKNHLTSFLYCWRSFSFFRMIWRMLARNSWVPRGLKPSPAEIHKGPWTGKTFDCRPSSRMGAVIKETQGNYPG